MITTVFLLILAWLLTSFLAWVPFWVAQKYYEAERSKQTESEENTTKHDK